MERNGIIRPVHADQTEKKKRDYKLIVDPALKQGPEKVYRYDGIVPGVSFRNCKNINGILALK